MTDVSDIPGWVLLLIGAVGFSLGLFIGTLLS